MKYFSKLIIFAALLAVLTLCVGADVPEFNQISYGGEALGEYAKLSDIPTITGKNAYCINLDTGTVIYQKAQEDKAYPASAVKLLTALVAYENIENLEEEIVISESVVRGASGAHMSLKSGEVLTLRELLYGVMINGANDAAMALAEYVSGDIDSFCELMNKRAEELGAVNSSFDNVTGLHSKGTYSTALDMAVIARAVYYTDELFQMSDTTRYVIEPTNKTNTIRTLLNRNTFISRVRGQNDYYQGASGMSLGGTPEGGQCIVSTFTTGDNLTYLCVVLGSSEAKENEDKNYACSDAAKIFDYCRSAFAMQTVASTSDVVCELEVSLASDTDHVTLFPEKDIKALLPKELDFHNDIQVQRRVYNDNAKAPIYKGDEFGEIVVLYKGDVTVGKTKLVAGNSVDRSNLLYFFSRIEGFLFSTGFKVFAISAVVLYVLYLTLFYYAANKRKKTGRRK